MTNQRLLSEIECCGAVGALKYHWLDKFLWMKSRETISLKDVTVSYDECAPQWSRVSRPNCNCIVGGHSRGPHEHTDYRHDRVPVFQMEVLSGERCAETLMIGLGAVRNCELCQRGDQTTSEIN